MEKTNKTWLVFANETKCNHAKAFGEIGCCNWRSENVNFAIGDIVYVFMNDERRIRCKTIVTAIDQDTRIDKDYWNEPVSKGKSCLIEKIDEYNKDDKLNEDKLLDNNFHGGNSILTPMYNNRELFDYITNIF